jgi:alkaline phosphatase D
MSENIKLKAMIVSIILALFILQNMISYNHVYAQKMNLAINYGIASGDVTSDSAVIWSRANGPSQMHVKYDNASSFPHPKNQVTTVNETTDFTGHIRLDNLNPDSQYYYRVWFSAIGNNDSPSSSSKLGRFHTAPSLGHASKQPLSFAIGGDLGGTYYCRRVDLGYPIFSVMNALAPDFFIFNGDQIYADFSCPSTHQNQLFSNKTSSFYGWHNMPGAESNVTSRDVNWNNTEQIHKIYVQHWEYNRADPHLQNFLANTSMYSQADDHEVIDDYGGQWTNYTKSDVHKAGFPNLVRTGIATFFNFSPIEKNTEEPTRIYRSFNWGKDLDLFILDAHTYRSRSEIPDTPDNDKTLLGIQQLKWLEQGLLNSKATWKVVSTDVPITIPNCFNNRGLGCDNWATNSTSNNETFVRERASFLKFLDDNNIKNVVFVATDVHFAANVRVVQDFNGDGDNLIFYELVSGPLTTYTRDTANPLDPTINAKYLYSENAIFNFGYLRLQPDPKVHDDKIHLFYDVRDIDGRERPNSFLNLAPQ